ncbi:APC family permease [Congregibacter brevis]|uniref:APC family permease n=1 Tax=Congregibacter brevis TaxID=3081201 RepID=A0ABZ0IDE7_9GAMM|nr:APC family permease [Congregibacter sp. IMCC45268]
MTANDIKRSSDERGLRRELGLGALAATGICSMLGASVYVVPFMIQRNVPGIGAWVLPAFLFAALPAVLAALAYAILASAMPRAGGSYLYASRGLSPYLGFVASFSQWFGLSIVIGVIAYIIVPFLRDVALALEWNQLASVLETGAVRVGLALAMLWTFVCTNLLGSRLYTRTLIPLMLLMFTLGAIVVVAGFSHDAADFAAGLLSRDQRVLGASTDSKFDLGTFLAAAAILFSSFIGFDSIAQAGGEARNPRRNLPLAIGIAMFSVGSFYFLFTAAVYHTVPWQFVASESLQRDVTAPGLLSYVLPGAWAVAIIAGAAIALLNDLPAMLLAVSRLMFAWAQDGIFPKALGRVHPKRHTPQTAIIVSGVMATLGILGSHFASDFFLGIDIMVTSMLVNFMLMCLTVITLPKRNPVLASKVTVLSHRPSQLLLAWLGMLLLAGFLVIHVRKDLSADLSNWYFHSTPIWLIVMTIGSAVYFLERRKLQRSGVDLPKVFSQLPPE